jgi:insulysin
MNNKLINTNKIEKSVNDFRDYEWVELDNKLRVIVITDLQSSLCGALLNVNVGSVHDTLPGMAHFLEHMVFMGSEKYPNESNFMDSVAKNGGMTNAFTSDVDTTYYFNIGSDKFLNILDMFSWFFIKPLLLKDGIEREVNAVDSEAKKNLLDDAWIFHEIIKKNMLEDHPINHFTCGNKDFLAGDDLHEKVKDFFDKYYSSNIMYLIVFINDKIDKNILITQIVDTFGKIENKNLTINKSYGNLIKPNNIIKYISNKHIDSLNICIEIPNITKDFIYTPAHLIDWILSSKSENSLFKIYENLGFIIESSFGEAYYYDDYILYVYKIILTDEANNDENIYKIIQIFFDYISSISKSNKLKDIYETMLLKDKRDFDIVQNKNINDTLMDFNFLLQKDIHPKNLLNYDLIRPSFEKIKPYIDRFLKSMKLYNSFAIYSSKKIKINNPEIDQIFKTKYTINKMEPIKLNDKIYEIINKNKYIKNEIIIIDGNDNYPIKNPEIINKKYVFGYNFNSSFRVPYVNMYISIEIPDILSNADIYMKSMLYLDTIYSDFSNIISDLEAANYTISLSLDLNVLFIYIRGDNKNYLELIDLFDKLFNLNDEGKSFSSTKQKLYKIYNGFENEQPVKKISKLILKSMLEKYFTPYDLVKFINNQKFNECKETFLNKLQNAQTSIVISGNIDKDNANFIADKLYNLLNIKNELSDLQENNLKQLNNPYIQKYKNKNNKEKNTIFTMIYEISRLKKGDPLWKKYIAFAILLDAISNNNYFNNLRTKEQLGYIVNTKIIYIGRNNYKICGLKFMVQSPIKDSEYLYKRTTEFVKNDLYNIVNNLQDEEMEEIKSGEIAALSEKFNNLQDMDLYLCVQIFDRSFMFNYKEDVIDSIKNINKTIFLDMYKNIMLNSNKFYSISIDSYKKN